MARMDDSELDRFPRYREALRGAIVADLEPGDAIYIPYLWWHGVQSLDRFNILVNSWFNRDEAAARYPFVPMLHLAFRAYRDMTPERRNAWRALYDHYVFQTGGDPMNVSRTRNTMKQSGQSMRKPSPGSGKRCANCLAHDASRDPNNRCFGAPDCLSIARGCRADAAVPPRLCVGHGGHEGIGAGRLRGTARARDAPLRLFGDRLERAAVSRRAPSPCGWRKRLPRSTN